VRAPGNGIVGTYFPPENSNYRYGLDSSIKFKYAVMMVLSCKDAEEFE